MHSAEEPGEGPVKKGLQFVYAAAGQTVNIRNELDLILHACTTLECWFGIDTGLMRIAYVCQDK
jgi:hypothetical protein